MSRYGRFQVAEPLGARIHLHQGETLREVSHPPRCPVLDQQDLLAQGIFVDTLIPGAKRVAALSSCTANATVAKLSSFLPEALFSHFVGHWGGANGALTDAKGCEEAAIRFYHACTSQTGNPGQEWPPTDCGSSGPYIVSELARLGLASGAAVAHGPQNIVSLLQHGSLLAGTPFLNVWEEPAVSGFVDGNGSYATLEQDLQLGVAGGHEYLVYAIVKLAFYQGTDVVDPFHTILRARNSWSRSWGDVGDFLIHLSTLVALGASCDFRLLTR